MITRHRKRHIKGSFKAGGIKRANWMRKRDIGLRTLASGTSEQQRLRGYTP